MKHLLITILATFLTTEKSLAQRDSRPCGLKIAPCPSDQECIPGNPDCPDINRCIGHCEWKNTYPDCGGFRRVPKHCDETSFCDDDPREPESCGMACDIPGICIPNEVVQCGCDEDCSEGLWCYEMTRWMEGEYLSEGSICL